MSTMRAIIFNEYGGPDVLQLADVPLPEPGPGQVRVAVRAAGVNPIDWKIRKGAMGPNFPMVFPRIPGLEVAGVVDAAGYGVLAESVELRGTKDRIVTIADGAGSAQLGIPFTSGGAATRELLVDLADRVVTGGFRVAQGRSYPLAEAAAAQQESEAGHPGGKITLAAQ